MNMEILNDFLALSLILTREDSLDITLVEEYLARLQQVYLDDLDILITTFNGLVLQ
jgi:hypothetical protein